VNRFVMSKLILRRFRLRRYPRRPYRRHCLSYPYFRACMRKLSSVRSYTMIWLILILSCKWFNFMVFCPDSPMAIEGRTNVCDLTGLPVSAQASTSRTSCMDNHFNMVISAYLSGYVSAHTGGYYPELQDCKNDHKVRWRDWRAGSGIHEGK